MNIIFFCIKEHIAETVYDHINAFQQYSRHKICYFDVTKQQITLEQLNEFDAVVIHYTVTIFNEYRCPNLLKVLLRHTRAKKIVFIQDEYRMVNEINDNLAYLKIDMLFTCVPEGEIEKVYPASKLPDVVKINTLTGFVPENLLHKPIIPYKDRTVDVVYRARKLSAWYGRLGREKWMISEKFSKDAVKYNLKTDLSYREEDRIYGDDWIHFLQNAKAALGCESGASVFDFTGDIQKNVELYEQNNPNACFDEIEEQFFAGLEGKITLNQISPRCFECAALGTLMILYEGHYSGVLKPWQHYIPLKKDHSNMDEVVEYLRDPQKCQEIINRTYQEIALNERYSYKKFIENFDLHLNNLLNHSMHYATKKALAKSASVSDNKTFELIDIDDQISLMRKVWRFILNKMLKNTVHMLIKLLPIKYGVKAKQKLICIDRRIMLSVNCFRQLLINEDFHLIVFSLSKTFCQEFDFIKAMNQYAYSMEKALGFKPLDVRLSEKDEVTIKISTDYRNYKNFDWQLLKKAKNFILIGENSMGIDKDWRGKRHVLKYKKLIKYLVGF